jgi:hypothetical protein
MASTKLSLGQAIDQIVAALEGLDEGARATAVETVCAHMKISLVKHTEVAPDSKRSDRPVEEKTKERPSTPASHSTPATDIRSLRTEKKPRSAREMACVVAFYLQELAPTGERKDSISTADLEKYFKQANFQLPGKIAQILPDAKGSGYFDSAARGSYKLNAVGYNLVAHKLPASSEST